MIRQTVLLLLLVSIYGCTDNFVTDTNQEIANHNWSYINKPKFSVQIDDSSKKYNLYLNLRHTGDYKYSNIFVLIHQTGPDKQQTTICKEFQVAYPDGEWLGSGSGNIYTYQLPFKENYTFPQKGTYTFQFEQNMRDNPLREITHVGLRVEPAEQQ